MGVRRRPCSVIGVTVAVHEGRKRLRQDVCIHGRPVATCEDQGLKVSVETEFQALFGLGGSVRAQGFGNARRQADRPEAGVRFRSVEVGSCLRSAPKTA